MVSITSITISLLGWEGMVSNEYEEKVDMKDEAAITFLKSITTSTSSSLKIMKHK